MTILPKKKATKDKPESENAEHSGTHPHPLPHGHPSHAQNHAHGHSLSHPHVHGHYHHPTGGESRLDKSGRGRTSPTRWGPSTSREEKLHSGNSPAYEFDFESHDSSSNHKRRHRSSPHRTVRKHRGGHIGHVANGQGSPGTSAYEEEEELEDGYNSEDEHAAGAVPFNQDLERLFEENLKEKKGLIIKKMGEDGNCLFRAIADQIFGDQEMHSTVRNMCMDYMAKNSDFYRDYVTEDFTAYINRKRMDHCHGNNLEVQALAEIFNRPVEVYQYSLEPINTFHTEFKTDNPPIRISYHQGTHYNSVVDPYKATVGVGLGLPGYQPGLADRMLMEKAMKKSENQHLEKAMLEDKMRETDWELTQESIEEQVARESYLQWLKEQEAASKQRGPNRSASATCSSSSDLHPGSPEARTSRSPRTRSGQNSPQHPSTMDLAVPGSSSAKSPRCSPKQTSMDATAASAAELGAVGGVAFGGFSETSSLMDLPTGMFSVGLEEDDIMAQVMALSQQEYLDSLKQKATASTSTSGPSATITTRDLGLDDRPGCSSSSDWPPPAHGNS